MKNLRLTGVPEHFNYPFRLLAEEQPFLSQGIDLSWKEESRGSGQMIYELNQGNVDFAILLTESFLKEAESNPNLKMIGFHVDTPLIWGIHVEPLVKAEVPSDLPKPHFLVSRMGSGSHLMARVLLKSLKFPWIESPSFEEVSNLDGAISAMEGGSEGMFLWEKFTTSPTVRAGKMKRIGELPSPWPCFVMVVSLAAFEKFGSHLMAVRNWIYQKNKSLKNDDKIATKLSQAYHLDEDEVKAWLKQTDWTENSLISAEKLDDILLSVSELGITQEKLKPEAFILQDSVSLLRVL